MAKHTTRNIGIVVIVIAISIGAGVLVFTSDKFTGELFELSLSGVVTSGGVVQNAGVDCRVFNQMSERGVNGVTRNFSIVTSNIQLQSLELVSTSSSIGTLDLIDTSMRVACDPIDTSRTDLVFQMVGGTIITRFYATQENGQEILIKSETRNITTIARDVLNRDLILPTGTIRATEIDSKLTSTTENYITRVRTTITSDLLFKSSDIGNVAISGTAVVQGILTIKVHNEIVDPPQPTSFVVDLTEVTGRTSGTETIDLADEISTVTIRVRGQLPQWSSSEGVPFYDIVTPRGNTFATGIRMDLVRLIDSSTNTFEFTDVQFAIGTSPELGFWQVTMHSNQDVRKSATGLPSTDTKVFKVIDTNPEPEDMMMPPTPTDSDGDGIPDSEDQCPFEIGTLQNNGCPDVPPICNQPDRLFNNVCVPCEPPFEIINGMCSIVNGFDDMNLTELVLEGNVVSQTTITFSDGTQEQVLSDFALPNLIQQISELVPAELIGTTTTGKGKEIQTISVELFYFNRDSGSEQLVVDNAVFNMVPTVNESTVSMATGNTIQFVGVDRGNIRTLSGLLGNLGFGASLGIATITTDTIVDIGEDAMITTGQSKQADIELVISGRIDFSDRDEQRRFFLSDSLIVLKQFTITNNVIIITELVCTSQQLEIIDDTGKVIECITPPEGTPRCFSDERPVGTLGYACTPQDVITFCSGDRFNCTEKDRDNDGVPDYRDKCRTLLEDGISTSGNDPDDGCPAEGVVCNDPSGCIPPPPPPPPICTEEDPIDCPEEPLDLNTILIVGGIALLIIGVLVFVLRRRSSSVFTG